MGAILIINKVIAACSLFLSLFSLSGCCWEFGSVIYRSDHSNSSNPQDVMHEMMSKEQEGDSHQNGTADADYEFWTKFDIMSDKFRIMIIISLWGSIVGLLIQFTSSAVILLSSRRKTASRSKYWVAVHFLTFILLLATLFVPLTYNRNKDAFFKMPEFNSLLKNGPNMDQGVLHYLWYDLHLYYISIFIDLCFLFIGMIIVSCLLRVHETNQEAFYAEISNRYK